MYDTSSFPTEQGEGGVAGPSVAFCTGFGQADTRSAEITGRDGQRKPNPHPAAGLTYQTIAPIAVVAMVENPHRVDKSDAQWIIPSTYAEADARSHSVQRERGSFWLLPLDVDAGDLSLDEVDRAIVEACGEVNRALYSTRSAQPDNRKWRAFVALSAPISGADYSDTVHAFYDLLAEVSAGELAADRALCRPGQLVYLPNRGDFYDHRIARDKPPLALGPAHPIIKRREQNRAERAEIARQAAADQAACKARRAAERPGGPGSVVDAFNAAHEIVDLLINYEYAPEFEMVGLNWRSPYQTSGSYATRIDPKKQDHWVSYSGSDAGKGLGRETARGARSGDAFDLYVHFKHDGDFNAAVRDYAAEKGMDHATLRKNANPADYFDPIETEQPEPKALFFAASDLAGVEAPPREWVVKDLIPRGTVTLFSGDGGTGKSLLSLQLAVAVAGCGVWIGMQVKPGGVMFLSAEDDRDELHRRLTGIGRAEGFDLAALGRLKVASLAGEDALLATISSGVLKPTPLYAEIDAVLEKNKPVLAVLDTSADLFGGNENDRAQVRQFVGMLRHLAIKHNCAVVLLSHPSVAGMSSGSGQSGSTGWNNSVRSRIYLERIKDERGNEPDPNARRLSSKKANYGPAGLEYALRWQQGIFISGGTREEVLAGQDDKARRVFLALLAKYEANGLPLNPSSGANYAPKVFSEHSEAEGVSKKAFASAMQRLMTEGAVEVIAEGPRSRRTNRLALAKPPAVVFDWQAHVRSIQ